MNYNLFQKITSVFLIFVFFFSITFKIPLYKNVFNFGTSYAENWNDRYNIVSIFVDEEIYPEIKSELDRYAKDISWVLEKTRAVIVPVPKSSDPFSIASLNEKFYYEGYDKDSKLIWTVLVGQIPFAVVNDWSENSRTIFPYVDFEDKWFIYNHKTKKYEKNKKLKWKLKAEIWHGVISPNSSDKTEIQALKDFFDKNHDFYTWEWNFKKEHWIINWKIWEEVKEDYKPYVFYYDWIRENKALVYTNYKAYENSMANLEDLSYNRFTKKLSDNIKDVYSDWWYTKWQKATIKKLMWVDLDIWVWKIETSKIPDIHTRRIIENSVKNFSEIFNEKLFWDVAKDVHNAGRYNETVTVDKNWEEIKQARVNVDTVPEIITKLDEIARLSIKNANTDLEDHIDDLVRNKWLSRYIALFQRIYDVEREKPIWEVPFMMDSCIWWEKENRSYHKNILYWKLAKTIWEKDYYASKFLEKDIINKENGAKMCSIYRWSIIESQKEKVNNWEEYVAYKKDKTTFASTKWWYIFGQLVEANRWRDVSMKDTATVEDIKDDLKYVFNSNELYETKSDLKRWFSIKYSKYEDFISVNEIVEPDDKKIKSLIELDLNILRNESNSCLWTVSTDEKQWLLWRFWMSSPLYIDQDKILKDWISLSWYEVDWEEKHTFLNWSIIPLFSINWSKNIYDIYAKPEGFYSLEWDDLKDKVDELTPSAAHCLQTNFLTKRLQEECIYLPYEEIPPTLEFQIPDWAESETCKDIFRLPIDGQPAEDWSCETENTIHEFDETFSSLYKKVKEVEDFKKWERKMIFLWDWDQIYEVWWKFVWKAIVSNEDEEVANEYEEWWECDKEDHPQFLSQYFFKKIYSDIKHKSPNYPELYKQITGRTAYSLPVDKDRYIDFMSAIWENIWIKYPYLFRIKNFRAPQEFVDNKIKYMPPIDIVEKELDKVLDLKSDEINKIIDDNNPEDLEDLDLEIYEYLKIEDYPEAEFDLKWFLKDKPSKILEVNGETKELSYYDTLVFAIYWNNLTSPSEKYKYVMRNYLSDQFGWNDNKFPLIENKKVYEIAYLWENWNAQDMFVKLDPKLKAENPTFENIIKQNTLLSEQLSSSNIWNFVKNEDDLITKCAPPEWVPLYKWPSAISCWIKDMLPPKIKISKWTCWGSWDKWVCKLENAAKDVVWAKFVAKNRICKISDVNAVNEEVKKCDKDNNKNGINDCTEQYLNKVEITTDSKKYLLHSSWKITASLKTSLNSANFLKPFDDILIFDNTTDIEFKLLKVEASKDQEQMMSSSNRETIFEVWNPDLSNREAREKLLKYMNFYNWKIRAKAWEAFSSFSTKGRELDFTFEAFAILPTVENKKRTLKIIRSEPLTIPVRAENLFTTNYLISKTSNQKVIVDSWLNTVVASDWVNIFLSNSKKIKDDKKTIWLDFSNLNDDANTLKDNIDIISNAKEKLVFDLSRFGLAQKQLDLNFPLNVKIIDLLEEDESKKIISEKEVNFSWYFEALTKIQVSGEYLLEIIDSSWIKLEKEFFVKADIPNRMKVDLSTSITETWGNITTHLLTLYDKYNNVASWELYDIAMRVVWWWVIFDDWKTWKKLNVFEWYKNFILKSTDKEANNQIEFMLVDELKNINLTVQQEIKTLSDLEVNVRVSWEKLVVWAKKYNYTIEVTKNWEVLTWFNSRAYSRFNDIYLKWLDRYIDIKDWVWIWVFETKTVAIKDAKAKMDIKVEWVKSNFVKNMNIYPEAPIRIDFHMDKDKLVVLDDWDITPTDINTSDIFIELKDRYNNLVFEDKSEENKYEFKLSFLDILDSSIHRFYASDKPKDDPNSNFRDLKWKIQIKAINQPWVWHFIIEVTPWLENNSFTVKSEQEWWEDLVVNWISKTAWKMTSYFLWNKNNIKDSKYNALYTTLLWADYWNVSKQDYLAWALLFEKNNRSLAVTTLLNSPYKQNNIFNIKKDGNINFVNKSSDLWQNITVKSVFDNKWWFSLAFYNESINSFIWQIYYYFQKSNLDLIACKWNNLDFITCKENKEKTSIILKSSRSKYEVIKKETDLILQEKNTKKQILKFDKNWKLTKEIWVDLELSNTHTSAWIGFYVTYNGTNIWVVSFVMKDATIIYSKKEKEVSNRWNDDKNLIWVFISSGYYNLSRNFNWIRGRSYDSVSITYNDPFENKYTLNHFAKLTDDTYESFNKNQWVGWKDWNKTLLSFAAWKNVWEATKDYQSFHLVNLWDPVIYLKKIQKKLPWTDEKRQFDSTIWKLLLKDDDIVNYSIFDYNNDKIKDIVILKNDWHVKLLEWTKARERFIDKWSIVYFWDVWANSILVSGDFTWDWFWDIVLTSSNWELLYINNNEKNFDRKKDSFETSGKIMQLLSFDMDKDWKDDIITFDRAWELNIFYWWWSWEEVNFTKKTVEKWLWLTLNKTSGTWKGAIFFKWLYQIKQWNELVSDKLEKNKKNIEKYKTNEIIAAFKEDDVKQASIHLMDVMDNTKDELEINDDLFNSLIFEKVPYIIPWAKRWDDVNLAEEMINNMEINEQWTLDPSDNSLDENDKKEFEQYKQDLEDSKKELEDLATNFLEEKNPWNNSFPKKLNNSDITTFVKTKYIKTFWLDIKKTFFDVNAWILLPWDKVKAKIIIKNTSAKAIENVAYLETIPELLSLNKDSLTINNKKIKYKPSALPNYNFLVDSYSIPIDWELVLEYETEVLEYKMWFIKVWLFEKDEVWDDEFWDIIFKNDENNCWEEYDIYRSISVRDYKHWTKAPSCKAELPDVLKWNDLDVDGNQIPDKYDELIKSALEEEEDSKFKEFSKEGLDLLSKDSDWDWIPDLEDNSPFQNDNETWLMNNLDKFNEKAEKVVDNIEFAIQGFWCWFGWWSCISSPMNWAPFAPWWDPTLYWQPMWDWFHTFEWLPIFSLFTLWGPVTLTPKWWLWPWVIPWAWNIKFTWPFKYWERLFDWEAVVPVPPTWPVNPIWAWGRFWYAPGPVRIFLTLTITGAIWTAICFWDNIWAWYLPTPWLSPIVPWWNCIVAAAPLFGCSSDWSDGDITDIGSPDIDWWTYWVYNWNCNYSDKNKWSENFLKNQDIEDYITYKTDWTLVDRARENLKEAFKHIAKWWWWNYWISNQPIFKMWNKSNSNMWELNIKVDPSALSKWNFRDVVKMKMTSIPSFPEFIMEWVKEQWQEIINYADFPTVTVILPDFSWLWEYEWDNVWIKILESFEEWKEQEVERIQKIQENKIKPLQDKKEALNCPETGSVNSFLQNATNQIKSNNLECLVLDEEINKLKREQYLWTPRQATSGIKSVYKFLWTVPIINIYSQKIFIDIPWVDKATLDNALFELTTTRMQWENEIKSAAENWTMGYYCDKLYTTDSNIQSCKEEAKNKAIELRINSAKLLSSLDKNIQILKDYKELPEKLQLLIRIKEKRLQQVLCNIRIWSEILPKWLKLNWKRFKSWVELYVLIKAILKSWQVLPDLFADYEAECKQCKNERWDSINFFMELISMLIPKLPIIKLPKMPDVNIDLHNIRAWITVALPEFEFNFIPITIPKLPELYLPARPNLRVDFELPEIPVLSDLKLPDLSFIKDLPDLPSLPEIQLPNLPPAPTLPKLFSSIDKFVDILKIISKAMCLLRQSPFIPEWRAGDQIAFITERWWYLDTDFHSQEFPQFSFPWIDSVDIKTYVNLEFQTDFVVDLVKNITDPLQNKVNNVVEHLNIKGPVNFDLRWYWVENKKIEISEKWIKTGQNIEKNPRLKNLEDLIKNWQKIIKEEVWEKLTNREFKKLFIYNLEKISWPETDRIKNIWQYVAKRDYNEADKLNNSLLKDNMEKFSILEDILNTEIIENKKIEEKLKNWNNIRKLWKIKTDVTFISQTFQDDKIKIYNKKFEKYNKKTFEAIKNLNTPDDEAIEINEIRKELNKTVNNWLNNYFKQNKKIQNRKRILLAWNANLPEDDNNEDDNKRIWCNTGYVYKWIYISEKAKSYRLFDYLDELDWKEEIKQIDFDNDKDDDLLYMVKNQIYLKENLEKKEEKEFFNASPIIYNEFEEFSNNFIESINWFRESVSENWAVNVQFTTPTNKNLTDFRLEFYPIVDKFDALKAEIPSYVPINTRKYIVDSFLHIDDITSINEFNKYNNFEDWYLENKYNKKKNILFENENFKHLWYTNKHLAYIENFWTTEWITIETKKFIELAKGSKIGAWKKIYTKWNNTVRIKYNIYKNGKDIPEEGQINIPAYWSVEFSENDIEIVSILAGKIYITSEQDVTITWAEVREFAWLPILPWTTIKSSEKERYTTKDYLKIKYYNDKELNLHFSKVQLYRIRDLWVIKENYLIRLNIENDFYYAKMFAFNDEIEWTTSKQLLISPQKWSDNYAPELNLEWNIIIPVYQKQQTDITPYVYEDSWIENITKAELDEATSLDWRIKISLKDWKILLDLWEFEEIIKKKIKISLTDDNGNIWEWEVTLLIYPPVPEITEVTENLDKISWTINELLENEPINMYRFRWWVLTKLLDKTWNEKVNTNEKWEFEFLLNWINSWETKTESFVWIYEEVTINWEKVKKEIAQIDEKTWKLSLKDGSTTIKVLPSNHPDNDKSFLKTIISKAWKELYYNYLVVANTWKVNIRDNLLGSFSEWIYIEFVDKTNYSYYEIVVDKKVNPWTLVIYDINDSKKEAIFTIFRDWRINVLWKWNWDYKINYSTEWEFPIFNLVKNDQVVAKILIKTKWNYTIR